MRKLMLSALAVAGLATGAVFAQDAGTLAGSAWSAPNPEVYGPVPGTPEYYGNSGWPPAQQQPYIYGNRTFVPYANRNAQPAYPYVKPRRSDRDRDRDGDGIPNRRDRYPDNPYRY